MNMEEEARKFQAAVIKDVIENLRGVLSIDGY